MEHTLRQLITGLMLQNGPTTADHLAHQLKEPLDTISNILTPPHFVAEKLGPAVVFYPVNPAQYLSSTI